MRDFNPDESLFRMNEAFFNCIFYFASLAPLRWNNVVFSAYLR
jgi:hypothetical protein